MLQKIWIQIKGFFKKIGVFLIMLIGIIFAIIALITKNKNNVTVGDIIKDKKKDLDKKKKDIDDKIKKDIKKSNNLITNIKKKQKERDKKVNKYIKD